MALKIVSSFSSLILKGLVLHVASHDQSYDGDFTLNDLEFVYLDYSENWQHF